MLKLNQQNEHLDMNIRPCNTDDKIIDGKFEQDDSDVCINLSIKPQITQEFQTQPFLQTQQITQSNPMQNKDGLIQSNSEILQGEVNQSSSIEELSKQLNNNIDSYLQELRQPKQFLEQLSLKQSESYEEDSSESLCQKIYSKFISQINLSVIQSYDQLQSIDEQCKYEKPLSLSTPILNEEVEIFSDKIGQKTIFLDQAHLTCSYPLSQA